MISVIIPAYNAQRYIDQAIKSVQNQECGHDVETLVVDDGSTDRTADIAGRYAALLAQPHQGSASARNAGLYHTKGEYVFFLDADDLLLPGAFHALLEAMEQNAGVQAVFAQAADFVSPELGAVSKNRLQPRQAPYFGCLPGCALLKKALFEQVGLFDRSLRTGETVDWLLRLKDLGLPTMQINRVTLKRRLHTLNTGVVMKQQEKDDYLAIIRKRVVKK